jgi:iron complex transport system substrate-binding protein
MNMNRYNSGILAAVLLLSISCRPQSHESKAQATVVEDMQGREVSLPADVGRIVGVRPGALRLLAYMGATDKIVGIEQVETGGNDRPYMRAHPELLKQPLVGPRGGDAELIANTHPDVIFMTYASAADADALQAKTGVPVVVLEYPEMGVEIENLYASLALIGRILHREERADSLATYMRDMIRDLHRRTASIAENDKPGVYIGGIAHGRAKNITSTHPDYPPFVFVNARNVAGKMDRRLTSSLAGAYIDMEQLLLWNPDVIFVDESGIDLVQNDMKPNGLPENLTALQTNRIYTLLTYNSYAVNYDVALINSWFIGKTLYPESFADIAVEEKAGEILEMLLGKSVFHEMITPASFKPLAELHSR